MHFPLSVALARTVEDLNIATIARHHDFWWERERFLNSSMFAFFEKWFPPIISQVKHVVVNSIAQKEFKKRKGIKADIFWDTFNFNSDLNKVDSYSKHWRKDFGIDDDDIVFLQPTRIVPRKRVEISIDFVRKLNHKKAILVLAGYAGDEGKEYELDLRRRAMRAKIRFLIIGDYVNSKRRMIETSGHEGRKRHRIYTLWDCFVNSDFVMYPTMVEGFGNQFVETMYFKKPIIITPYPVYKSDIAPIGFKTIEMPHRVTEKAINRVKDLIENEEEKKSMIEFNFQLAKKNYDYRVVKEKLRRLFRKMRPT
jgi:glycosyltransferase involved in cell wall biosynthesis